MYLTIFKLQDWNIIKYFHNNYFTVSATGSFEDDKFMDAVVLNLLLFFNRCLMMGFDFTYESFTLREVRSCMCSVICQGKDC